MVYSVRACVGMENLWLTNRRKYETNTEYWSNGRQEKKKKKIAELFS